MSKGSSQEATYGFNPATAKTLLIVVMLMLSNPVPARGLLSEPNLSSDSGDVGDLVHVYGNEGDVGGGLTALLYWDSVKQWDGTKGILNASVSEPSGYYTMSFTVPESTGGKHYLWVTDDFTGSKTSTEFTVTPSLIMDTLYLTPSNTETFLGKGFGGDTQVTFMLRRHVSEQFNDWPSTSTLQLIGTGDDVTTRFTGTLSNLPLKPGTAQVTCDLITLADTGNGTIIGSGGYGEIDYVTGDFSVSFSDPPSLGSDIDLAYEFFEEVANEVYPLDRYTTSSSRGNFMKDLTIPQVPYGSYWFCAMDSVNNTEVVAVEVSPIVKLSKTSVDTGDVIQVRGEDFTPGSYIRSQDIKLYSEEWNGSYCAIYNYPGGAGVPIDPDGEFTINVIMPNPPKTGDYTLLVSDSTGVKNEKTITVNTRASVQLSVSTVDDEHTITVTGKHFTNIKGRQVSFELWNISGDPSDGIIPIGAATTDAFGSFTQTISISKVQHLQYLFVAVIDEDSIQASEPLQITSLSVTLYTEQGKPGDEVKLSGNGFTKNSNWSAKLNTTTVIEADEGTTNSKGQLRIGYKSPSFTVPELELGIYRLIVTDETLKRSIQIPFTILEEELSINTEYPVPRFTTDTTYKEGEAVLFNASESSDSDGIIISYKWDFGDGDSSTKPVAYHTFNQDGIFTVSLTVKDNKNAKSTKSKTLVIVDLDPAPNFDASKEEGYNPLTVKFTDTSSLHDLVTYRQWDFGDGSTSQQENPEHTYTMFGVYTVSLTLREIDGDEVVMEKTQLIVVMGDDNAPPRVHTVESSVTGKQCTLYAVVTDNSDIKSVYIRAYDGNEYELIEDYNLPGLYMVTIPYVSSETVDPVLYAMDYNGNYAQQSVILPPSSDNETVSITLSTGWNSVTLAPDITFGSIESLIESVECFGSIIDVYGSVVYGTSPQVKSPYVKSIWTIDEYRGYLMYDPATGISDFDSLIGGREYWVYVDGSLPVAMDIRLVTS
ncbi:MAG: PKD domain-containing protein [Candidatus Bathyarchaeota archaeon]|nr:PKD domain-containing protein [Candidatus Bathyarchaeota archaeon]